MKITTNSLIRDGVLAGNYNIINIDKYSYTRIQLITQVTLYNLDYNYIIKFKTYLIYDSSIGQNILRSFSAEFLKMN